MTEQDLRLRALELAAQSMPSHRYTSSEVLTRARLYEAYVKTGWIAGDEPKPSNSTVRTLELDRAEQSALEA